jgi:hypothetical protein
MLNFTKFRENFHPVWAKMMANLFRRGISVQSIFTQIETYTLCQPYFVAKQILSP